MTSTCRSGWSEGSSEIGRSEAGPPGGTAGRRTSAGATCSGCSGAGWDPRAGAGAACSGSCSGCCGPGWTSWVGVGVGAARGWLGCGPCAGGAGCPAALRGNASASRTPAAPSSPKLSGWIRTRQPVTHAHPIQGSAALWQAWGGRAAGRDAFGPGRKCLTRAHLAASFGCPGCRHRDNAAKTRDLHADPHEHAHAPARCATPGRRTAALLTA